MASDAVINLNGTITTGGPIYGGVPIGATKQADGTFSINTTSSGGGSGGSSTTGPEVALVSPPALLTANTDTLFTFASAIKHVLIQNNSAALVNVNFDAVASAGSLNVAAGSFVALDIPTTVVHLYSTAATNVNGTAAANIVLKGWS